MTRSQLLEEKPRARIQQEPIIGAFYRYEGAELRLCVGAEQGSRPLQFAMICPRTGQQKSSDTFLRAAVRDGSYKLVDGVIIVVPDEERT